MIVADASVVVEVVPAPPRTPTTPAARAGAMLRASRQRKGATDEHDEGVRIQVEYCVT